jgi:hypothetical protein
MYKPVAITCLILFCSAVAAAQNKPKPNLSGSWIVDFTKSEKTNNFIEDSEKSIMIEQNDPEIKITRKFESFSIPTVYYTDERGESFQESGEPNCRAVKDKVGRRQAGDSLCGWRHRSHDRAKPKPHRRVEVVERRPESDQEDNRDPAAQFAEPRQRGAGHAVEPGI